MLQESDLDSKKNQEKRKRNRVWRVQDFRLPSSECQINISLLAQTCADSKAKNTSLTLS